jgi:uncharacterized protein (DUF4415 family)
MSRFDHLLPIIDEEEERIQAGIVADPDAPELTDEELASMRPARECCPRVLRSGEAPSRSAQKTEDADERIRVDQDRSRRRCIFQERRPGWQTCLNDTLKKAIAKKR